MWNGSYQKLFEKEKVLIKEDACINFYNERRSLYLETDASGVGLAVGLLHIRNRMNCLWEEAPHNDILGPTVFTSKNLYSAGKRCSNIQREA